MLKQTICMPPLAGLLCGFAWLLSSLSCHAEGIINIKPYAAATLTYDDNVFRFANRAQAVASLGSPEMSDWLKRAEAGVNMDVNVSRQKVRLELGVNKNTFDRNSFLNNEGNAGKLAWYWQVGNDLSGELSTSQNKAMAGFSEIHNPVLNLRTYKRNLMRANWDVMSNWRLYVQRDTTEVENSLASDRSSDREDIANEGGIQFTSTAGTILSLSVRDTETTFPNQDSFSTVNTYDQREVIANMQWQMTGKTRIRGHITNVRRQYEELSQRDFNACSKRVDVDWAATGKSSLTLSAWEEIYGVDDLGATYVKSDGASISPTWLATSKISVTGQLSYEKRIYLGDPGFILGGVPRREDEVQSKRVAVTYAPITRVQMQVAYTGERRNGTISSGYTDNAINAMVRFEY